MKLTNGFQYEFQHDGGYILYDMRPNFVVSVLTALYQFAALIFLFKCVVVIFRS